MDTPLVSIITPAYNAETYLEDTIKSVLNQDYPCIEHIVIDDGSIDGTSEILKSYENKYNLRWLSKTNEGQVITLNKCIDMAKGEIIVWLNADDVLFYTTTISSIAEYFGRNDKIKVVYGNMAIINNKNKLLKIQYAIPWLNYTHLVVGHSAACICYRRETLLNHKFDARWDFVMDYEQCLRMAKNNITFGYLNEILLGYRRHHATKSVIKYDEQLSEAKKVKILYGKRPIIEYASIMLVDRLILMVLKIQGLKDIFELTKAASKSPVAFPITFGSKLRLIINQIIPYVYINI